MSNQLPAGVLAEVDEFKRINFKSPLESFNFSTIQKSSKMIFQQYSAENIV